MKKIHTRIKRKFGLSRHFRHYRFFHLGIKKHGPKTFGTEESAHAWALKHSLKPEEYCLKRVKRGKRFQVIVYNKND